MRVKIDLSIVQLGRVFCWSCRHDILDVKTVSKILILIGVIVALGGGLGVVAFKMANRGASQPVSDYSLTSDENANYTATGGTLYQDESGFSFKHPMNLKVSDITPNDETYYSLVDVREGNKSLRVSVKDGEFKVPADATLVGAATLGGIPAKQYSYKVNSETVMATVAVQGGIVYLVEGPKDGAFWEDTQNIIVSSFNIGLQAATSGGGSTIDEGEEIVE